MSTDFNIMCFAWNADGLRICNTTSADLADRRKKWYKKDCEPADFMLQIIDLLKKHDISLATFSTEHGATSQTYFHAEVLINLMVENGYTPVYKEKEDQLRVSIFVRKDQYNQTTAIDERIVFNAKYKNEGSADFIVSQVYHKTFGRFMFIAVDMDDGKESKVRNVNTLLFKTFMADLLSTVYYNIDLSLRPNYLFLLGDFDTIIESDRPTNVIHDSADNKIAALASNDELKKMLSSEKVFEGIKEGVNGKGPEFLPNARLAKGRSEDCRHKTMKTQCFQPFESDKNRVGWHDRVLYLDNGTGNYTLSCFAYDKMDSETISKSSHAGVYGLYSLTYKR